MIRNAGALAEIRKSWAGVEALRAHLHVSALASGAAGRFPFALANAAHNVPFIHAYAVLNDVLEQLEKEGNFRCSSIFLGPLLKNSEKALPWKDFALVKAGYVLRRKVAHKGRLLDRGDCWKYIDAIRVELSAWRIL